MQKDRLQTVGHEARVGNLVHRAAELLHETSQEIEVPLLCGEAQGSTPLRITAIRRNERQGPYVRLSANSLDSSDRVGSLQQSL
eukprot:6084375-Pleurochrysis_carterae.AAC.2